MLCDPACGTAGFLVAAGEYLRERHLEIFRDAKLSRHFHHEFFHGFDFDNTMLRIGSMNMLLHGVENPDIRYRDSLAQDHAGEEEKYTLVLANPHFAGSLDYENCAKDILQIVKTKKTELLFLALFLRLLKPGGHAAVIVPDGVLFGSSNAHKTLRKILVEEQKLDAVISLPGGVFKPCAGVSTAILVFTKTNSGGTDHMWIKSDNINTPHYSLTKADEGLFESEKSIARIVPAGSILVTCIAGSPDCIGNAAMADREFAFNQQINAFVPEYGDPRFYTLRFLSGSD